MSIKIDAAEVLYHLNDLGYTNINGKQLKLFIKDLKKLIKYEETQLQSNKENVIANSSNATTQKSNVNYDDVLQLASREKIVPRKENVICVEINRAVAQDKSNVDQRFIHTCKAATSYVNKKVSTESVKSNSKSSKSTATMTERDAKAHKPLTRPKSFIRPPLQVKQCKSDPVALYHHYQEEWKKFKIPGTDSRADIRWMIREKMLGAAPTLSR